MEELRGRGVQSLHVPPAPASLPTAPCSAARELQALRSGGFRGGPITRAWPAISSVPRSRPGLGGTRVGEWGAEYATLPAPGVTRGRKSKGLRSRDQRPNTRVEDAPCTLIT